MVYLPWMSRIANAYASKFKTVLSQLHARRIDQGTRWFLTRAQRLSETEGITPAHGLLPAVWVPPTLTMLEQLALVFGELGLEPRESRCMSCGGELQVVDKEAVRDRIPPRTYLWRDEFFECVRCHKLFWHGTHWEK